MRTVTVSVPDQATCRRWLLLVASVLALCLLAYLVRQIWIPLGLAFLLAMVLDPVVDRMEMRGWSRTWASLFIFGSFLVGVIGVLAALYPYIAFQAANLQAAFNHSFPDHTHQGLINSFRKMGLPQTVANAGVGVIENAQSKVQRSSSWIADYGMSIATNAIWIVIVPIVAFYALKDFHLILAKGLLLVPSRRRDLVQTAVTEITGVFGKYLRGLTIVSVLNGIATGILLTLLGVPGALILGIIAGILYSVPYVGTLLFLVITAAFAFVGGELHLALMAVASCMVLHQLIFDQIITPRILGGHVGLHPILSIVALLIGNLLLGIVGMILAVPVAACIQIAVLALQPKLSQEIELAPVVPPDTVESLAQETKEADQKIDATQEIHASVISAVESIEQAVQKDERSNEDRAG